MPRPKSVSLDGQTLNEVLGVHLAVATPTGPRGDYEGRTAAATIVLKRRARNTPTVKAFEKCTNEDGHLELVTCEVVLENSKREETYTIDVQEAFISGWHIEQPPDDDTFYEVITLKVGKMTLGGGGGSASFEVPEFNTN